MWTRHRGPFPLNSRIQALAVLPGEPRGVLAAGDTGVFGSHDGGASWVRTGAQGDIPTVWSLAVDPSDPATLFAGTRRAAIYRSQDGGERWERLPLETAQGCAIGQPFVTRVLVDPTGRRTVWAGIEIDGVYRSLDRGDTWTRVVAGLGDLEVHDLAIAPPRPARVLVSTNSEVSQSANGGDNWRRVGVRTKWPLPYVRGITVKADEPDMLFASAGETTTGETGAVLRSRDGGETWRPLPRPVRPNATV